MYRAQSFRQAFTLVELLVVVAIVGILVGMLLPAIQMVREAARRASCLNKLKQLTIACHNYESSHQRFPAGAGTMSLASGIPSSEGSTWLSDIMVEMEMRPLQNKMMSTMAGANTDAEMQHLCGSFAQLNPVPHFQCPSAIDNQATDGTRTGFATHYIGSAGPSANSPSKNYEFYLPNPTEPESAIGIEGLFAPFSADLTQALPVFSRLTSKRFQDIKDGASNSFAIGELSRSRTGGFAPFTTGWTFGAAGTNLTVNGKIQYVPRLIFGIKSVGLDGINANRDYIADGIYRNSHCFNSNHPGGSQFSMADGSVRFIGEEINLETLKALSSIKSGVLVSE